ncbi:major capsid protein [Chicken microvirus mg4_164]|nr:major capsid protein [Chicken microvirus mg4_164]
MVMRMSERYKQPVVSGVTRFTNAPVSEIETSRMISPCYVTTTFNGGDIVPVRAIEVLPRETYSIDVQATIRQLTMVAPTMDSLEVDLYAFFVPHRIVNESWKAVQGENYTGAWVSPEVSLVPLLRENASDVQVPVGSVADHYDFPTQMPIPAEVLQQCNDLVFRGYLEIYNEFFRNQNYQPPIPYSKLNIYEGFFESWPSGSTSVSPDPSASLLGQPVNFGPSVVPDGSPGAGAIAHAVLGSGGFYSSAGGSTVYGRSLTASSWTALSAPLKANKRMDYFTSCLPSPQKGPAVTFSLSGTLPIAFDTGDDDVTFPSGKGFSFAFGSGSVPSPGAALVAGAGGGGVYVTSSSFQGTPAAHVVGFNLKAGADLSQVEIAPVSELRDAIAIQQVYEQLARGGSRYREFINSFFGLDVEDPFSDIPVYLGHIRRGLDQYQTAQTSATSEGGTPQATLAAFGYTNTSGKLFGPYTAKEHGYIHILAVVRHRNVYSSFMSRDKFRLKSLDWYNPILANLSEQPVYTRELNPFAPDPEGVVGYQEPWAEYRMDPDTVSGLMRPGVTGTLSVWNYADDFDSGLTIVDGDWLKSNTAQVVARTTATSEASQPQFKARFALRIDRIFPGPTYSVPGLDIV